MAQRCVRSVVCGASRPYLFAHNSSPCPSSLQQVSPARRKRCSLAGVQSTRAFSISTTFLQDANDQPEPQPASQSTTSPSPSPSQATPTRPRPASSKTNSLYDILKMPRTQNPDYVRRPPSERAPLDQQLKAFDVLDVMSFVPKSDSSSSSSSRSRSTNNPLGGFDQIKFADYLDRDAFHAETDAPVLLRLKPTLGRTQAVDLVRNVDLGFAFRLMERKCTSNAARTRRAGAGASSSRKASCTSVRASGG